MASRRTRVLAWLGAATLTGILTWVALPAGITDLGWNGNTAAAQTPKHAYLSGVSEAHISYAIAMDGDPGSAGGLVIDFTAGGNNPTAKLPPDFGQCDIPTGVDVPLIFDREVTGKGTVVCNFVPHTFWTSTSASTAVSPDFVVNPAEGKSLEEVSATIKVSYPQAASSRIKPEQPATRGLGYVEWSSTSDCTDTLASADTGESILLTCTRQQARIQSTVTILDDPDAQNTVSWRMFLAGILVSACTAALAAAVQEGTREDSDVSDGKAAAQLDPGAETTISAIAPPEQAVATPPPQVEVPHEAPLAATPQAAPEPAKPARRFRAAAVARRARARTLKRR